MRAVWVRRFGPPEVLEPGSAPDPVPGAGQVLVDVEYAGISFIETMLRAGRGPGGRRQPLPYIPGNAVGGVVRDTGARVVSTTGGSGGYASLAAVAAADLVPVPAALDVPTALALLADGRTALGLHRTATPLAGEWVLVEAAAGGLGSLLTQLALGAGARVLGAAGNPAKLALVAELGATPVDYTDPGWAEQVRALTAGGLDLVYDGVGGSIGATAAGLLRPDGRFVQHGLSSGTPTDTGPARARGVTILGFDRLGAMGDLTALSAAALAEAAAGRLTPTIGQTYPLAEAARAHAVMEAREALGKTLLRI
jgi:NADPH:quinone reductase